MILKKVRLGIEKTEDGQQGVLILDTEPRGHVVVHFEIGEVENETVAEAHSRVEAQAREILRLAAEAEFPWGSLKRG
ncbi:MAG TPA: hypothetical protein VGN97_08255 [Mesorhizobium sp.]|nr:hypothetical protein [Mesorhizobium sp.]